MGVGRCRPDVMHVEAAQRDVVGGTGDEDAGRHERVGEVVDRKSTRLNSSHSQISYAVFCLKKKKHKDSDAPYERVYISIASADPIFIMHPLTNCLALIRSPPYTINLLTTNAIVARTTPPIR